MFFRLSSLLSRRPTMENATVFVSRGAHPLAALFSLSGRSSWVLRPPAAFFTTATPAGTTQPFSPRNRGRLSLCALPRLPISECTGCSSALSSASTSSPSFPSSRSVCQRLAASLSSRAHSSLMAGRRETAEARFRLPTHRGFSSTASSRRTTEAFWVRNHLGVVTVPHQTAYVVERSEHWKKPKASSHDPISVPSTPSLSQRRNAHEVTNETQH
ncbi:SPFH domain / Band 7 family protein [Toxoplasma gondii p89]|uniref:SPFH domain / Band 7 family protein n=1 Tax=Toxoplasma gondii p89 TaxID=943119 RepID=A0A086JVN1_TOXGO|nr:SPFH domain / Band 7 family protein [Toxoplasma gondii p89]